MELELSVDGFWDGSTNQRWVKVTAEDNKTLLHPGEARIITVDVAPAAPKIAKGAYNGTVLVKERHFTKRIESSRFRSRDLERRLTDRARLERPMNDPAAPPDATQPPVITIAEPVEETARLLRSLQAALLMHPFAARAAIRVLVAEGRAFAETEEGRRWRERLDRSSAMRTARTLWEGSRIRSSRRDCRRRSRRPPSTTSSRPSRPAAPRPRSRGPSPGR